MNGNGKVEDSDQFGFLAAPESMASMLLCGGNKFSSRDSNGDPVITANTEKLVDGYEKLFNFFFTENVSRIAQHTEVKYSGATMHNQYFVPKLMSDEALFYLNNLLCALDLRKMENDFGMLPMPKYDESQENYMAIANNYFSDYLLIPSTNTDLAMTGHIIEAMCALSSEEIIPAFIETTVMNKSVRDEDSANMLEIIRSNLIFDISYIYDWGKCSTMFQSLVTNKNPSYSAEYAANESVIKAELEKTVKTLRGE